MDNGSNGIDFSGPVPIFPLPDCVLLPRAVLPLHFFEPRYKDLARDTLASSRLIAMALLRPGYEETYNTHVAPIHRCLCLGRILRDEKLGDGRVNVLLQGICRATIEREDQACSYRRGWLCPAVTENGLSADDADRIRRRLLAELDAGLLNTLSPTGVLREVIQCPDLSPSDMLDLLAFNLISDPQGRQAFLEEADLPRRADHLIECLAKLRSQEPNRTSSIRRRPSSSDN
ncbi:MAG: LON peptidase substrate-binding domain-containing protein [Phycisphaerae bacterium]